jgi:uncharacterized damage-inducible protein DinB
MDLHDIRRLYAYDAWANARMIDCIRALSEEQFTRRIDSSFPSIRETLAHIVMAEWLWLRRWTGENPTANPDWMEEPSLDTLVVQLQAIESERTELLARLSDEDLANDHPYRAMDGSPFSTDLGGQMAHVANHSTYHRGQLTTMLRQVGATPPATDLSFYIRNSE